MQREKGESAHDAWKVGEESDSKPSVIDQALKKEAENCRLILTRFIRSQHRHDPVAATGQAHQMQTWVVVAVVEELCTASK